MADSKSKKQIDEWIAKSKKRNRIIIIGLLALLIGIAGWLSYVGNTDDIERVASQLKVDDSWELKDSRAMPPRTLCLDSVPCPSLQKTWRTNGKPLTHTELETLLKKSGWSFPIESDCTSFIRGTGSSSCSATGVVEGYTVSVDVIGSLDRPQVSSLVLDIRRQ